MGVIFLHTQPVRPKITSNQVKLDRKRFKKCPGFPSGGYCRFPGHPSDLKKRLDWHFIRSEGSNPSFCQADYCPDHGNNRHIPGRCHSRCYLGAGIERDKPTCSKGALHLFCCHRQRDYPRDIDPAVHSGHRQPPSRGRQRGFLPLSLDRRFRRGSSPASWFRWWG